MKHSKFVGFGLVIVSIFSFTVSFASTNIWVAGSTAGWNSESSWIGGVPTASSIVAVPEGVNLPVLDGDVSLAGIVAGIYLEGSESTVTFGMEESDCTIRGTITGAGMILKEGSKTLFLTNEAVDGYYVKNGIRVLKGVVEYPQTFGAGYSDVLMHVGHAYVAAGAVIRPYACYRTTVFDGLTGNGKVSCGKSGGAWPIRIESASPCVYDGTIEWYLFPQISSRVDFTAKGNYYAGGGSAVVFYNPQADLGVMSFGKGSGSYSYSSLGWCGYNASVRNEIVFDAGGRIRFLGASEDTDRWFKFLDVCGTIDACAGQLTLSGKVRNATKGQAVLTLASSNTVNASVLDCEWEEKGTNAIYVVKQGIGTWRLVGSDKRLNAGVIEVEEGVLQVDSLAETNVPCSLGLSTRLARRHVGAWEGASAYQELHDADYAVLLGSAHAEGVLEYVGDKYWERDVKAAMATRPIAVTGLGGRIVAGSDKMVGIKGAFAADDAGGVLTLDGETPNSVLYDVMDNHGPLSVFKEGFGTWTLCGNLTFSGSLAVKAGTLVVSEKIGKAYTWYRFTITKSNLDAYHEKYPSDKNTYTPRIHEIALFDVDGHRVNTGIKGIADRICPDVGQVSVWQEHVVVDATSSIDYAFDNDLNGSSAGFVYCGGKPPRLDDDSTWIPFVMRIDSATSAVSYDLVTHAYACNPWDIQCWTMEASSDGVFWDKVADVKNDTVIPYDGMRWYSNGDIYSVGATAAHHGYAFGIDNGKSLFSEPPVQLEKATISVAHDAILKADGDVTLHALEIDIGGAGTIDGFSIAKSGTVNVIGSDHIRQDTELPLSILNADGAAAESFSTGWRVKVNGRQTNKKLQYKNGKLVVLNTGLVITVR